MLWFACPQMPSCLLYSSLVNEAFPPFGVAKFVPETMECPETTATQLPPGSSGLLIAFDKDHLVCAGRFVLKVYQPNSLGSAGKKQ